MVSSSGMLLQEETTTSSICSCPFQPCLLVTQRHHTHFSLAPDLIRHIFFFPFITQCPTIHLSFSKSNFHAQHPSYLVMDSSFLILNLLSTRMLIFLLVHKTLPLYKLFPKTKQNKTKQKPTNFTQVKTCLPRWVPFLYEYYVNTHGNKLH